MPPKLDPKSPTTRFEMKVPKAWMDRVDDWRATLRPIPNRNEAVRLLVDQALDAAGLPQSQSQKR